MIVRLPFLSALVITASACSTAQLTSPITIAAIDAGARCIGSFIDVYDMSAQIRATLAEHQQQAHASIGRGN